jgi:hypothetical protein
MESKTPDAAQFRDGQQHQLNTAATGWRKVLLAAGRA